MEHKSNDNKVSKVATDIEKKLIFERFLTYRRRMARLCAVQGIYLYDADIAIKSVLEQNYSKIELNEKEIINRSNELGDAVLYFYRNVFFDKEYADNDEKRSKIDERYLREILQQVLSNLTEIDKTISKYLNERWTIDKIEMPIKAILRCGVSEVLYNIRTDIPILTSEYTNMTSCFFSGKQIGFVNGIVDKIAKMHRR
ncbi:MAG: hypothetical protein JJW01_01420 [Alphaproteobacteria bacterium]|nr:hypothetical protein [Rickettsiales bacterium]